MRQDAKNHKKILILVYKMESEEETVKMLEAEWRRLEFYCEGGKAWRLFGDKKGIKNFSAVLKEFCDGRERFQNFNDMPIGPYAYLTIRIYNGLPLITSNTIAGSVQDLRKLAEIILEKMKAANENDVFFIDKEFGNHNQAIFQITVMADGFDPVTLDPVLGK